jgi:hypothetical protein
MLNWDKWLPALMPAYNTNYHSTIATTPFELLFGIQLRLPHFQLQTLNDITMVNHLLLSDSKCCTRRAS